MVKQEQNDELDKIKSVQAQDITPQNGKSEGQEQDEAYDIYSSISQLDAIIKSKQTQGKITEVQQEQDEGYDIIKPEQAQGIDKKDGKSDEQEQDKGYDIIKAEKVQAQAQDITPQNGKSEEQEQEQDEVYEDIKPEQAQGITT